jgi:hypothetical protein
MGKRRRPAASRRLAEQKFWGVAYSPADTPVAVRPTPDPGVVVRSLGAPPLAIDGNVALRHLSAVYEEAVRAATALAAANDLLAPPEEED